MSVHAAYFFAGIVVGVLVMLFAPSTGAFVLGRDRVAAGEAFLAELLPDDGRVLSCACLQGNVARYLLEHGPNVGGPMCLNCARAEFVAWCLNSRPVSAREIAAHRRLLLDEDEGELLAIEHHPDPQPPKQAQP